MKKLLSSILVAGALCFVSCNNEKKADAATTTTPEKVEDAAKPAESVTTAAFVAKAHACGAECKDGNHVYAHGDVGHTCTEAGVAHACTDQCKDGNHVYAHGETGHTCVVDCAKM